MDFTFGIITGSNQEIYINKFIDSIENEKIPNYQIIIVGEANIKRNNTEVIKFDESIRPNWITRKKNIITENAKYDNIVFTHDYLILEPGWYKGYLKYIEEFGDFDVIINKIINVDNTRYRDWILNSNLCKGLKLVNHEYNYRGKEGVSDIWRGKFPNIGSSINFSEYLIPYDIKNINGEINQFIYISGTYWVAKKKVMIDIPLNEDLLQSQGEDVDWSQRISTKYIFNINEYSTVKLQKNKILSNTAPLSESKLIINKYLNNMNNMNNMNNALLLTHVALENHNKYNIALIDFSLRHYRKYNPNTYIILTGHGNSIPENILKLADWYYWNDGIIENELGKGHPYLSTIGLKKAKEMGFKYVCKTRADSINMMPDIVEFCHQKLLNSKKDLLNIGYDKDRYYMMDLFIYSNVDILISLFNKDNWNKQSWMIDGCGPVAYNFGLLYGKDMDSIPYNLEMWNSLVEKNVINLTPDELKWLCFRKRIDIFTKYGLQLLESNCLDVYKSVLWPQ